MVAYDSIPQSMGEQPSRFSRSSALKTVAMITASMGVTAAIFSTMTMKSSKIETLENSMTGKHWPDDVYTGYGSGASPNNHLFSDSDLGKMAITATSRRPQSTTEAAENGWVNSGVYKYYEECVPQLGYAWTYKGGVTEDAPVTLYFSKETKKMEGVLTGMAVHYFGGVAPKTMTGTVFTKGADYDTIRVAFRNKETNVCGQKMLPMENDNVIDVILADGSRKSVPVTEAAAKASGEWAQGACLANMGTHYLHDVRGGDGLPYDADHFFPIVPMYDTPTGGSLNGIFFQVPAKMQTWNENKDPACGEHPDPGMSPSCFAKQNMWDAGPGLKVEIGTEWPLYMCSNFCHDQSCDDCRETCKITNASYFSTMHAWFKDNDAISTCPKNNGDSICGPYGHDPKCVGTPEFPGCLFPYKKPYGVNKILTIRPENRDKCIELMKKDQEQTLSNEPGALQFMIGEDTTTPNMILSYEEYKSYDDYLAHKKTSWYGDWLKFGDSNPWAEGGEQVTKTYTVENGAPERVGKRDAYCLNVEMIVNDDQLEVFHGLLKKLNEPSTPEPLEMQFVYGQPSGKGHDHTFFFHEEYDGEKGFNPAHISTPHFQEYWKWVMSKPQPWSKFEVNYYNTL